MKPILPKNKGAYPKRVAVVKVILPGPYCSEDCKWVSGSKVPKGLSYTKRDKHCIKKGWYL